MNTKKRNFVLLISFASLLGLTLATAQDVEQIQSAGKATYRLDLPNDPQGNGRRLVKDKPLVSNRFTGPIPANDWCSSLIWPLHSPHSLPMFPHPLGIQAHEQGLGIGYTAKPKVTSSFKDGKEFQSGTSYKYPYRESLLVGLDDFQSERCVVDGHSDWAVTSLWQQDADELRATFAHGSPFVYFRRSSDKPVTVTLKSAPINRHEEPVGALVYEVKNVTRPHAKKPAEFKLSVNAGTNVGIGSRARLTYDFDGDGKTDRVETFNVFATDPVDGSWETYDSTEKTLDKKLTWGEMQDFKGGTIRLEFWKCFGKGGLQIRHASSSVVLPFADGDVSLTQNGRFARKPDDEFGVVKDESKPAPPGEIFYQDAEVVGVTINGSHFALFAPSGAKWQRSESDPAKLISDLAGKDYLSAAVLPDDSAKTLSWFQQHAYAFVNDTRVTYHYDAAASRSVARFTFSTEAMQGSNRSTIFALYRHQHLHVTDKSTLQPFRYASPRGEMKVIAGESFETSTPFLGVLPALPIVQESKGELEQLLDRYIAELKTKQGPFEKDDTYWNGKEFGKISEVIQIANQLGKHEIRDDLLGLLKSRIEDWADGEDKFFFYYDKTWDTLIGYPDSFGSADQLNDHHFHYSYFIKAAATIAQYDPDWVRPENYGEFIDLLIRDCANYDRDDSRFPWLRNFDPYAGHSWASGHAGFASGNNQESSSESMNFATSLILYGQAVGDKQILDLGIYWHATEAEAIRNYWFDNDRAVFPDDYGHSCVGMVWGDGGTYGTWWTANPEEIHGINYLPLNAGSLYLGRDTEYVRRNFANLLSSNKRFHNGGFDGDANQLDRWHDVVHEYLALADPAQAIELHQKLGQDETPEFGETKLHTWQWMNSLSNLGTVDISVLADHPTAIAFNRGTVHTYVVYNSNKSPVKVTFSNGAAFDVPRGLHRFSSR